MKKNYELEYLKLENEKLKEDLSNLTNKQLNKELEKDISNLLHISMRMKRLLEICRSSTMLPVDLGKEIDKVIKEIESYG